MEVYRTVARKNRRRKAEYKDRLGFNPYKYITPQRGDIWFVNLGEHPGTSVQSGYRPALVLSNNTGNAASTTVTVLPMTTRMKKFNLPFHVELTTEDLSDTKDDWSFETSMILAEQITTVSKSAFGRYVGRITDDEKMAEIERGVCFLLAFGR